LSEVLLQRTQANTVAVFFRVFIHHYPSWKQLARATEEELQELFKPVGLWRQKARALKKLATDLESKGGRFPKQREAIEALPGVGQYIANAVLLFCHGESEPLLDASMARVLERYFGPRKLADIRHDPYLQSLARKVVAGDNAVLLNWALLDLAALVCKPRTPLCEACPVARACKYNNSRETPALAMPGTGPEQ